jgi:CRISPR-associated protein Csx17
MSLHVHRLEGCRPSPLAHYLKALAVLRLVGEQADASARGFWKDDVFHLVTMLDRDALETFFLEKYEPTPIVGPWNGGSGFYEGDSISGREAIQKSSQPRFSAFKEAIDSILKWPELPDTGLSVRSLCQRVRRVAEEKTGKARDSLLKLLGEVDAALTIAADNERRLVLDSTIEDLDARAKDKTLANAEADRTKKAAKAARKVRSQFKSSERSAGKEALALAARQRLPDVAIRWLDAAVVSTAEGDLRYPPLLGSGGNEGRRDYTNAFMDSIQATVISQSPESVGWLRASLWGLTCAGLKGVSADQFNPAQAGGQNQGMGFGVKVPPNNPWDYLLNLEGAIVWTNSVSRVGRAGSTSGLSSPFTVRLKSVSYCSSAPIDEERARAELWAPLWAHPIGHAEMASFMSEARAQIGRRTSRRSLEHRAVGNATEFAEAAASLGIARGIREFVRFALLERRGKGYYLALPAGRFAVYERSEADLIRGLDPVLADIDAFIRGFRDVEPPKRLSTLRRGIDEAVFDALSRPSPLALQAVLSCLGDVERFFAQRDRSKKPTLRRPLGGLSPRWLLAADDGSLELRIAASLASIQACGKVGPLRANLTGIDPGAPWAWAKGRGQIAWTGASLPRRLASVLGQRMMDAERLGCSRNPLHGLLKLVPADVASFMAGEVDDSRIEYLLLGLCLLDWRLDPNAEIRRKLLDRWRTPVRGTPIPSQLALLKLVYWPSALRLKNGVEASVVPEPSTLPLLLAGRVDEACRVARRRLFSSGLAPVNVEWPRRTGLDPIRLTAALLLPCRSLPALTRSVLTAPAVR